MLIETLSQLIDLMPQPIEIIVIDQTEEHETATTRALSHWSDRGKINWIRRSSASIPGAMNEALGIARGKIVLFLDDDIVPGAALFAGHLAGHELAGLVAGQVLQPGETFQPIQQGGGHRFNSTEPAWINEFAGGNFSVHRETALSLGGFDENFVGAAYRYEAEFSHRYCRRHGKIRFEPSAGIVHLRAPVGGTRAHESHLKSIRPAHSVGEYYYLLRVRPDGWMTRFMLRPLRSIRTRHHLRHPWWIPLTLFAELRGMALAIQFQMRGPQYIDFGP